MKTYTTNNDSKQSNKINWEWCKEFGCNNIGANAYDYAVIVRKNGERLMCSDAETWAENTKGLRMASVAFVVMWCAFEYDESTRQEAKENGETLTRGCSSVVDFTANESGYGEFLDEVTANTSNTECEYFNGTTGAIEKCHGIADTVAKEYAQQTSKSEQYKQFAEGQELNSKATQKAACKAERLMHKYAKTLSIEDRNAWHEAYAERERLEEIEKRYNTKWYEIHDAWNDAHMPAINAFIERTEARKAEQTTDTPAEAVETATECHRLECRQGGAVVEIATGETVGKWGTDEDGFYAQLDNAHPYTAVHIVNDPIADGLTATEGENETETTNTPQEGESEPQSEPETAPEVVDVLTFRNGSDSSEIVTIKLYDNGRTYCENTGATSVMTLDEWENMRHVLYDIMGWGVTEGAA